jgi:hypothetical protein
MRPVSAIMLPSKIGPMSGYLRWMVFPRDVGSFLFCVQSSERPWWVKFTQIPVDDGIILARRLSAAAKAPAVTRELGENVSS